METETLAKDMHNMTDATKLNTCLTEAILKAAKQYIPKGARKLPKPVWNEEADKLIDEKAQLRKKAMATKTREDIENYQEASKRTTSRLNEMKRDCWLRFTSEMSLQTDPQQVFRVINAISGKQTSSTGSALKVNSKTLKGDRSKAEAFCP